MTLKLKGADYCCDLEEFKINGIRADEDDFGSKKDLAPRPDCSCGNLQFIPDPPTQEVLNQYKITVEEYEEICNQLKKVLSIGYCGLCSNNSEEKVVKFQ